MNAALAAYLLDHHLGLIAVALLAFGIIVAWIGRRQGSKEIAHLRSQNQRLLRVLERATGLDSAAFDD